MSEPPAPPEDADPRATPGRPEDRAPASDPLEAWFAAGMQEALRGDARPSGHQPSTLCWLARRDPRDPRLSLRGHSEAPASSDAGAPTRKYEIRGAIGFGGMGTVLRGHDRELGRDIAVKLLHGRHCQTPELVERFVAEARICGQLQHPGIVPVYDLGNDGGRPFFTMKLVEGDTLAALLDARTSLAADRQAHVRVFEQVCQTMAYAHARGVIHGDLKPANVMVGAFGEVQVMDWGFARVVTPAGGREPVHPGRAGAPDADAGIVFGTPGYMPPEQARGEVARVDARSDVFALGSILCEVLTGAPAYAGGKEKALAAARAGDLHDALARLRASDADQDLIALAEECLAPDPRRRPRSAQLVADRVAAHLASAARRAETARFRIMSARRAQRWTLALAGAFALAVVLGTAATAWIHGRTRELEVAEAVQTQMVAAREGLLAARSAGLDEPAWQAATDAAERALQLARDRGADVALVAAAGALRDRVAGARSDAWLRAALERTRVPQNHCLALGSASNREARRRHTSYRKELTARGIDPLNEPPGRTAERIRASSIGQDLVLALDDWALATLTVALWGGTSKVEMRDASRRLLAAAAAADPDAVRAKVRAVLASDQPQGRDLVRLLEAGTGATPPALTVLLAAKALRTLHDAEPAKRLLADAQRESSADFWIAFELALAHETSRVPDWGEACHFYAVAEALRPDLHAVKAHRAYALARAGKTDEAERLLRKALALGAQDASAQNALGVVLYEQHRLEEAQAQFRLAMSLDPDCSIACSNLGRTLFVLGRGDEARERVLELGEGARVMAGAHKLLGDVAAEDHETLAEALDEYGQALAIQPDFAEAHYANALVQRRLLRHGDAKRSLEQARRLGWRSPEGWEAALQAELDAHSGRGGAAAADAKLLAAEEAFARGDFAAADRLYAELADRIEPLSPQSWDAVCAAALASGAEAADGAAVRRGGSRRLALERLTAELAILRGAANRPLAAGRPGAQAHLRRWLRAPDLEPVRGKAHLERLPKPEAAAWRAFWLEVREELAR